MTPPATSDQSYTIADAAAQYDVPSFSISPAECALSYSAAVSPSADFITENTSGLGMSWYTTDSDFAGETYTITVTAQADCLSNSVSYTLTILDPCASALLSLDPDTQVFVSPLISYIVGSGDEIFNWDDSVVTSTTTIDCSKFAWSIVDLDTNSQPDPSVFTFDMDAQELIVNTSNVADIKTVTLRISVNYEDYSTVEPAFKDFTVSIDFPCETGVTYDVGLGAIPLNRQYTIGDAMEVDLIEGTFDATPDVSISGICWDYMVVILTELPADDQNAIVFDADSMQVKT